MAARASLTVQKVKHGKITNNDQICSNTFVLVWKWITRPGYRHRPGRKPSAVSCPCRRQPGYSAPACWYSPALPGAGSQRIEPHATPSTAASAAVSAYRAGKMHPPAFLTGRACGDPRIRITGKASTATVAGGGAGQAPASARRAGTYCRRNRARRFSHGNRDANSARRGGD